MRTERSELLRGFDLAGRLALEELGDVGLETAAGGAEGEAQGRGRLALAVTRVDLEVAGHGAYS